MHEPSWKRGRDLALERVARLAVGRKPGELVYAPTGLSKFDERFGGLELGCVTLLMAHTGEGKSSLMRQLLLGASDAGLPVLDISVEDPAEKTADRVLSNRTGIPSQSLNRLEVSPQELARLRSVAHSLPDWDAVDQNPGAEGLLPLIRRWLAAQPDGPALVGIDYLQRLADTEETLGRLGNALADLAKERGIAILAASQVKSEAVAEARRRFNFAKAPPAMPSNWLDFARYFQPQLSDAKACRRLEESAKCAMVFFRPGRWARSICGWQVDDSICELHIIKSNFGATGYFTLGWDGPTQRIYQR